ncbi:MULTISPECIES: putative HNHc nuclease [unclassified Bradyrhizobium]|uniref:DUF968 domain-containing protein n=1 Tax=unclassified Bradyrhizobium TaxID=2631580 RepID=UPI0028EDA51A|nr:MULTISPECIES: putative HNHc nuclease [unclassified Bradyrhizobium]
MTGQRIVRPPTAFSVASTKQRRPREKNESHLSFIRSLKCCICGAPGPDAAHLRAASVIHGKRETGGSEKPSDKWVVPLCRTHHTQQHGMNELRFWAMHNIEPFGLALSLYAHSGDDEICESVLNAHRPPK